MKNFFAVVGVLVVLFVGVGVWQGWFKFAVNTDNKVSVDFDGKKAGDDIKKGTEVVQEKLKELKKGRRHGERRRCRHPGRHAWAAEVTGDKSQRSSHAAMASRPPTSDFCPLTSVLC